ncbi:MAG: tRNA uracil 4-sulfurtransferase ThiI [Nitrososphaerota archaeon]
MDNQVLLVHHGEIVLKGRKRGYFERLLIGNLEYVLGSGFKITRDENRLVITSVASGLEPALREIGYVAGVSSYSMALRCSPTIEMIMDTSVKLLSGVSFSTFAVEAKRSFKGHPFNSMDVKMAVAESLAMEYGARVDYASPDVRVYVEVTKENAYLYREKVSGLGGLPVGSSGRVLMLLSGGVDSALASLMLIRRGCRLDYIHFHPHRSGEEALQLKIGELTRYLTRYGLESTLYMSDFTPFYKRVFHRTTRLEIPLFRRYMFVVADRIAGSYGCKALATGDSLSQVASQTLANIAAAEQSVTRPVLRPLVALDKAEILEQAKSWGILELAQRDYKDCCSIISRHPTTRATAQQVNEMWEKLGLDGAVEEAIKSVMVYRVTLKSGLKRIAAQPMTTARNME